MNVRTKLSSCEMKRRDYHVDSLDSQKWNYHAAEAVDEKIAGQNRGGTERTITHAAERQRYQRDNDQRVEDDRGQNRALRRREMHHVEPLQLRILDDEQGRDDREIFCDVIGDGESGERTARHQELFANLDDFHDLGRIGVEVDHVAGLA